MRGNRNGVSKASGRQVLPNTARRGKREGSEIGRPPSSHLNAREWRSVMRSLDLSDRQLEVVRCLFDGLDEPSIAEKLDVSAHTIHAHLNRLYRKICVKSRCEVIVRVFLAYVMPASARKVRTHPIT